MHCSHVGFWKDVGTEVELIMKRHIRKCVLESASKSKTLQFLGNYGRFNIAETLPVLIKRARSSGVPAEVTFLLPHPTLVKDLPEFGKYIEDDKPNDIDVVRSSIVASALYLALQVEKERLLAATVVFVSYCSLIRYDIFDDAIYITAKRDQEYAIRITRESSLFLQWKENFALQRKQAARVVELHGCRPFDGEAGGERKLTHERIVKFIAWLDIGVSSTKEFVEIVRMSVQSMTSPY